MRRAWWVIAILLAAGCGGGGGGGTTGGPAVIPTPVPTASPTPTPAPTPTPPPIPPSYVASSVPSGSGLRDITTAPDGSLWFTEFVSNNVGKLVPSTGTITEYSAGGLGPAAIVVSGTSVYVSMSFDSAIGVLGTDGTVKPSIPLPAAGANPDGIAFDKSGNLWVAEKAGRIARCDVTARTCTDFTLPNPSSSPDSIALGGDGAMWFTETAGNAIGRIDSAGVVKEYAITPNAQGDGIVAAADGSLWFAERTGNKIGHISTSGTVLGEFAPPAGLNGPNSIAVAANGSVWFTETEGNRVSKLTPSGSTVTFTQNSTGLTPAGAPEGITVGMDGRVYFAEQGSGKIGSYAP